MIINSIMYQVAFCSNCTHILIYKPAIQAKPDLCPKCGAGPNDAVPDNSKTEIAKKEE